MVRDADFPWTSRRRPARETASGTRDTPSRFLTVDGLWSSMRAGLTRFPPTVPNGYQADIGQARGCTRSTLNTQRMLSATRRRNTHIGKLPTVIGPGSRAHTARVEYPENVIGDPTVKHAYWASTECIVQPGYASSDSTDKHTYAQTSAPSSSLTPTSALRWCPLRSTLSISTSPSSTLWCSHVRGCCRSCGLD